MIWEIAIVVRARKLNKLPVYAVELISNQYGNETEAKIR